jgi:osmotically-inducible protein OsmY
MGRRGKWGVALIVLGAVGCSQDADRLARVCHKTAAKFEGVTESMRGKLQNGWSMVSGSVGEASLDGRVALRLRWDRDMAGADMQVRTVEPGTVELRGTVIDLSQRIRAVQLARATTGVENVIDALSIEGE